MGKPLRIALVVFAVAAALSLGLLATLWFAWDPLLPAVLALASTSWFDAALLGLLVITTAGVIAMLVVAIVAPSTRSSLTLEHDGGKVAIAKDAVRSTAARAIERHDGLTCKRVSARLLGRRDPRIRIKARVDATSRDNLSALGALLQDEVTSQVEKLTGYPVRAVDIAFSSSSQALPRTSRTDSSEVPATRSVVTSIPRTT